MPFFERATNVQANYGVFTDVKGDQHITGSPRPGPNRDPSFLNDRPSNSQVVVQKARASEPASEPPVLSPQPSQDLPISPAPSHAEPSPQPPVASAPAQPTSQPVAAEGGAQDSLPPALSSAMAKPKEDPKKDDLNQGSSSVLDTTLGITSFVLTQIQITASLAPIPFLGTAATIALSIVTNMRGARGNKGGFAQLAKESCDLVYVVIQIYEAQKKEGKEMPEDLNEDAGDLVSTLTEIQQFSKKMSERKGFKGSIVRVWNNKDDAGQIQSYRQKIGTTLNVFWLKSSIRVRAQLKEIADEQGAIHKDIREGSKASSQPPPKAPIPAAEGPISIEHMATLASVDYRGTVWNIVGGGQTNIMSINS